MKLSERMRKGLMVRPFIKDWANEVAALESELEKMEQAFRGRGFHEPGMKRCPHGMSHWIGSHCMYDEPILTARKD